MLKFIEIEHETWDNNLDPYFIKIKVNPKYIIAFYVSAPDANGATFNWCVYPSGHYYRKFKTVDEAVKYCEDWRKKANIECV